MAVKQQLLPTYVFQGTKVCGDRRDPAYSLDFCLPLYQDIGKRESKLYSFSLFSWGDEGF